MTKQLEQQVQEIQTKLDEQNRVINDINLQKNKLQSENSNLLGQLDEYETHMSVCAKFKQQLTVQIESAKRMVEEESRAKSSLSLQLKNAIGDLERAKEHLEEESSLRLDSQKANNRLTGELTMWKTKYETESLARAEELEETKKKLVSKIAEAEEQAEQTLAKCHNLEKNKIRLQNEMEDLLVTVDKANANSAALEKKQKQFDKLIADWKLKCDTLTADLEASQRETRQYSTEIFKMRSINEENATTIESFRRENSNLIDEIKELMAQLNSGKNSHDAQKMINRLEQEKHDLQISLEETELALEQEIAKVSRLSAELNVSKSEIDKRLKDKEDEFENTRRNHLRTLESIQASLEAEAKSRSEVTRHKKKLESDINDLEIRLNHANSINLDLHKENKRIQQTVSDLEMQIDDEQKQKNEAKEAQVLAERRASAILGELEDFRSLLEHVERTRKTTEMNLNEAVDRVNELTTINSNLNIQKRKLENDMVAFQAELNETINDLRNCEEKVRKTTADFLRVADELSQEQVKIICTKTINNLLI